MVVEKFLHLIKIKPQVGEILKTPVDMVDEKHLVKLWEHFKWLQYEFWYDEAIVSAAGNIIEKIDRIIALWWNSINKELMSASSDDYLKSFDKAA